MFKALGLALALSFVSSSSTPPVKPPEKAPTPSFPVCLMQRVECEMKAFKALEANPEIAQDLNDPECFILKSCFHGFVRCLQSVPKEDPKVGA